MRRFSAGERVGPVALATPWGSGGGVAIAAAECHNRRCRDDGYLVGAEWVRSGRRFGLGGGVRADLDLLFVLAPDARLGSALFDLGDELAEFFGREVELLSKDWSTG